MKISNKIIPTAYKTAKEFYNEKITLKQGIENILQVELMNKSSARDYLYNFKYLIDGKKFSRTLNEDSMEYFMKNILQDYGFDQLKISLKALALHIEYYEGKQNTTMHKTRAIYEKYNALLNRPSLVNNIDEIQENIRNLENGLAHEDDGIRVLYFNLIIKGICFIAYKVGNEMRFAPSRFVGYKNNKPQLYSGLQLDGSETNQRINKILGKKLSENKLIEKDFYLFCKSLGLIHRSTFNNKLKFWQLDLDEDFNESKLLDGDFPEGKLIERLHKFRERDSKVIKIAKSNFIDIHGKLFCEVCKFDFESKYGKLGKNFIEGHHTIAVSEMSPDYKTKPEEIVMLCSNCHRMVHKKRPWLTIKQLKGILPNELYSS